MEEIEKTGEQPFKLDKTQEEMKEILEDGGQAQVGNGSPIGKFNSPESLLEAYNNLQREFTKKCQKLSELEKHSADNETVQTDNVSPAYEKSEWRSQVAEFLTKNQQAKAFSKEISDEIIKDPLLRQSSNMLEIAWSRVLAKNYRTPEDLARDNNFMQSYVLGNEEVKKQVFSSYMNDISKNQSPSLIGSGMRGGKATISASSRPNNLDDAKNLVLKMFKN
ncbi:MAG: hypothetical protein J5779_03160 [Clostridia bacterium]|nr:hypothetical protein [Clostridia bacterium]